MKFREQVARDMCALQHVEWNGLNTLHLFGEGDDRAVDQHAWRLIDHTSFKPGEEYAGVRYATEEERNSKDWDVQEVFVILKKGPALAVNFQADIEFTDITIRENKEHQGIEIVFDQKPPSGVLNKMKAAGWRWNHKSCCWYNRMNEENKQFANSLLGGVA